jgi:hypothetical protein
LLGLGLRTRFISSRKEKKSLVSIRNTRATDDEKKAVSKDGCCCVDGIEMEALFL